MKFKKSLARVIPEVVAPITFLGSLAASFLVGNDIGNVYSMGLWGVCAASFIVSVIGAVIKIRSKKDGPAKDNGNAMSHDEYEQRIKTYLGKIKDKFKYLPLQSLDAKTADPGTPEKERLRMADVYIDMDTTAHFEIKSETETEKETMSFGEKTRPLTSVEAVAKSGCMVLKGGPGSGKSTFVNHLAYCLASEKLYPGQGWLGRLKQWPEGWSGMIPIPVALRDVAAWFGTVQPPERKIGMFQEYLKFWLKNMGVEDFYDDLITRLRNGQAILFLDGLDEIAVKKDVLTAIKGMCDDLPSVYPGPMLVTCRILSYDDPRWKLASEKWSVFELAKLSREKIDYFIRAWHDQLEKINGVNDEKQAAAKLIRAAGRDDLRKLAENPLLLTVMALVHTQKGELPDKRVLLYDAVVDLLLWKWEGAKLCEKDGGRITLRQLLGEAGASEIDLKRILWKLAFDMHGQVISNANGEAVADVSQGELIEALRDIHPDRRMGWAEKMVQIMQIRAGLLLEGSPGVYRFPHRTFQEYLAGRHLSLQADFTKTAIQLSEQGPFWREVILMAVGWLTHGEGRVEAALFLAGSLSPEHAPELDDEKGWRRVLLAGYCLNEIGFSSSACLRNMGPQIAGQVKKNLQRLVQGDRLEPKERADAGSFLGVMGWPDDLDAMIFIPEGEFIMGSSEDEVERLKTQNSVSAWEKYLDSETPRRSVFATDFSIGKYPVTNRQYAEFIASTDHEPPDHWKGKKSPVEWLTHPVVNVSWYDARQYCDWLSREKGREFRLPSETEWEKAARGVNGWVYPWGDDFDPERCNMSNTGIHSTSPVGIFNLGKSPYGCLDMSGNVLEWCATKWREGDQGDEKEMDENPEGDEPRVLRGGGFWNDAALVRCAFRFRYYPFNRYHNLGFRVVSPGP